MDPHARRPVEGDLAMTLLDPSVWSGKTYIGGWTVTGPGPSPVVEPATGDTLGEIAISSPEDVRHAAAVAVAAQRDWAGSPPEQRAAVLRTAGELWERHGEEIRSWIVREAGSIPPKAALETHTAAQECFEAAALPSHPSGAVLPSNEPRWSFTRRRPCGVVGVIAPFNFPLILSVRSVAPALALGNAVLLKPDPRTAVSGGVSLIRIFEEAGLPPGVLSLVVGGADVGSELVTAPPVRVVSFTGSTRAGRLVGELGARHLKRVHLELGGNSAQIVLPGADVAAAAGAGAFGSFMHQGQICMATGRHLVHESLYEDYVTALAEKAAHLPVGNPATDQVALGPIIDDGQVAKIHDLVTASVRAGARLAAGGTHEGRFYRPTVLADVSADTPAYAEEVFGPVGPVRRFSTVDEAVAMAKDSASGLALSVFGDLGSAMEVADSVPSGIVHLNAATVSDEANAPFGGVGVSGTGSRVGGAAANIEAFTETQWVTMRPRPAPYPF
jgi:benzaldehyde dehydrogenase (NAD)